VSQVTVAVLGHQSPGTTFKPRDVRLGSRTELIGDAPGFQFLFVGGSRSGASVLR
jgi:hypothetical protein